MPDSPSLDWDRLYADGHTPWEDGRPWAPLAGLLAQYCKAPARVLDVGCGWGTQTLHLAALGYDMVGLDVSQAAIDGARERAAAAGSTATFVHADFAEAQFDAPFDVVFDRGCWTNAGDSSGREAFARKVNSVLERVGLWLLVAGSADNVDPETGAPDPRGYPRQSLTEVAAACEPAFVFLDVMKRPFGAGEMNDFTAWVAVLQRRNEPRGRRYP